LTTGQAQKFCDDISDSSGVIMYGVLVLTYKQTNTQSNTTENNTILAAINTET